MTSSVGGNRLLSWMPSDRSSHRGRRYQSLRSRRGSGNRTQRPGGRVPSVCAIKVVWGPWWMCRRTCLSLSSVAQRSRSALDCRCREKKCPLTVLPRYHRASTASPPEALAEAELLRSGQTRVAVPRIALGHWPPEQSGPSCRPGSQGCAPGGPNPLELPHPGGDSGVASG